MREYYGVGDLTAITIIAELGDVRRFANSRDVVRYGGMERVGLGGRDDPGRGMGKAIAPIDDRLGSRLPSGACLLLSGGSSPGDAGEAAALVLAAQEFVANVEGGPQVGAARVLHRRGGRAAVAVRVVVAGGVPLRQRRR